MKTYRVCYTIYGEDIIEANSEEEALSQFEIRPGCYDINEVEAFLEEDNEEEDIEDEGDGE